MDKTNNPKVSMILIQKKYIPQIYRQLTFSPVVDLKQSAKYRDTIWSIRKGDEFKKIARYLL